MGVKDSDGLDGWENEIPWNEVFLSMAKDVERAVMPLFGKPESGKETGINVSGDVTKYVDKVSEDIILDRLNPLGINIVSEEVGFIDHGSDYTAVVDPIDGSYNFISGIPVFAFSFALFKGNSPVYAGLYEFVTGNRYEAIPGKGAYLNGERLRVKPLPPEKAAISLYTRGRGVSVIKRVKRIRVLGAIAMELAYLARGTLQAVVDVRNYVRPTDIAAGLLFVREAGGIVVDEKGKTLKLSLSAEEKLNVIAASDREILEVIINELGL